jgi:hypothetical protein
VDLNTWCNHRHNVPFVFPETQQFDNFNPPASLLAAAQAQSSLNFNPAVLGSTRVSFTASDPHAPAQYVQQWSASVEKSLGRETTLEVGYLGARGLHLQRADLINTISVFGDTANAGTVLGENPIRPNLTGQPLFGSGTHTAAEWFNPKAFSTPPAFTFGDVGRNTVIGPGLETLDFALAREFGLLEGMKFQFRAEFFNALNQVNLGAPDRFVNTPQFGTITEAATPGRQIQLGARLSF